MRFVFVLLSLALAAQAAPSDPGAAAMDFLEKVRLRKLNLEPGGDTALARETADEKKRQIARRIERMARDLDSGPLELGSVKQDADFAAVLVRQTGGYDPASLRVFPVALVRRGAEWTAAPVPASFENAGTGYVIALRKRLEALENWMLREQVVDLEKLRGQAAGRMRRTIEASLPAKELRAFSAAQVGERFLSACEQKDVPAMLGLLGGLSAKLPADWSQRLKSAERLGAADADGPLGRLTGAAVLKVLASSDSGGFSIAYLNPTGRGRKSPGPVIQTVRFDLARGEDGLWRVDLPAGDPEETDGESAVQDAADFSARWAKKHPPAALPSAEEARSAFHKALAAQSPETLLAISQPGDSLAAAQAWWDIHDPAAARHALPLAFQKDENSAVCLLQFLSTREPELLDARPFYFEKTPAGWWWSPTPGAGSRERFQPWVEAETRRLSSEWQQSLLAVSPVLRTLAAPAEAEARTTVSSWLAAARAGDMVTAISSTARLDDAGSGPTLLRNLGSAIAGFRSSGDEPVIVAVYAGRTCSAVGVRVAGKVGFFPIYPVVQTDDGPRILAEIDLAASGNRSREFLNQVALDRVANAGFAEAAAELTQHLAAFRAEIEKQSGE